MPYTGHGHWYGPGEPAQPGPRLVARCGGPGLCPDCAKEATVAATTEVTAPDPVVVTIDVDTSGFVSAVNRLKDAMIRADERRIIVEQLRRAAKGRRHYAARWPPGDPNRKYLETEAHAFDSAAKVAEGDMNIMLGLLPLVMWTAEEERYARGEQP